MSLISKGGIKINSTSKQRHNLQLRSPGQPKASCPYLTLEVSDCLQFTRPREFKGLADCCQSV